MSGGVLLSHAVPRAVPSALKSLTSGFGMEPGVSPSPWPPKHYGDVNGHSCPGPGSPGAGWCRPHPGNHTVDASTTNECRSQATRPISTGQLRALQRFHLRPINPVVCWGPYRVNPEGDLILRRASRLDAFSGYPFRT